MKRPARTLLGATAALLALYHGSGFVLYYHDRFHNELSGTRVEMLEGTAERQGGAGYRVYRPSRPLKRAWLDRYNTLSLEWDPLDRFYYLHFRLCVLAWGKGHTEKIWR